MPQGIKFEKTTRVDGLRVPTRYIERMGKNPAQWILDAIAERFAREYTGTIYEVKKDESSTIN